MSRTFGVMAGIGLATLLLVGACWLWAHSVPVLGERSFVPTWVAGMRCAAVALFLLAHAAIAWVVIPLIYRPRGIYLGAALCSGGVGILSAVAATALLLAGR